ncbi:MAG: TraB/GumN family protein [Oceanococcus sp.]
MSRILTLAVLLLLVFKPAWAEEEGPGRTSFDLLWSIKGESNRVYVLGSVHLLPHGARSLPEVVNSAYLTSDLVVFESDLFLIGSVDFEADELAQARYPAGKTINDEMPADLMLQVENRAETLGLPISILERYRPWFFAQTLATAQFSRDGFPLDNGVDVRLYRRAVQDIKLTDGLTSPQMHLSAFADMDTAQNEAFLRSALVDLDDTRAQISRTLDIYRNADLSLLGTLATEMQETSPALYKRLVADRNEQWMEKFEDFRKRPYNILVVVGALHLVGDQGLIQRFRLRDWNPSVPKYRGFRPPE